MRGTGTKAQTEWNGSVRREKGAREGVVTYPRVTPGRTEEAASGVCLTRAHLVTRNPASGSSARQGAGRRVGGTGKPRCTQGPPWDLAVEVKRQVSC